MIDLRTHKNMPPVYDQGQLSSCTANALVASFQYEDPAFFGSRLFLYYNERLIERDVEEDAGAQLRDGIKSLKIYGVCAESDWPYEPEKFDEKPPANCYQSAIAHKATQVQNIHQDINSMKNCLYAGLPFVVGMQVFEEFESQAVAQSGIVPMPTPTSQIIGGHAVLVVGYDDRQQQWIVRNSWGADWGDHGYFYLPYLYLLDASLASDLWSVNRVSHPDPNAPKPKDPAAPAVSAAIYQKPDCRVLGDTLAGAVSGAVSGAVTGVMSGFDHDPLQAALNGALLGATGGGISGAITSSTQQQQQQQNIQENEEDENKKLKQSAPL